MIDEPALPLELERLVFETTALLYPETIPRLLRVAHRVLIWIEPFLYRVIRVRIPYRAEIRALSRKNPEYCSLAVRHLTLLDAGDDVLRLLHTCKGITSLAISLISTIDLTTALAPILPERPIRRLGARLPRVAPELRRSLFATITHLAVFDFNPGIITSFCVEIPHLPALTHCSFLYAIGIPRQVFLQVLAESPRLQVLLLLMPRYRPDEVPAVHDTRFVLGLLGRERGATYFATWDEYWSPAEEFIAKKRRREIEETCHWLNQ